MRDQPYSWIFAAVVVLVGLSIALTGSVAAQSADLVVATDGSGDHTSIQNAVDNASDTARIKIKSGVYEESITLDKNVTIVTPERATLVPSPSGSDYSGISITEHAEPHISGLNLHNFTHGIEAGGLGNTEPANTSWSATDISIDGNDEEFGSGIHALDSSGEFNLRNITINNTYFGVYVLGTTDAWHAQNLTINSPGGNGISGYQSTGAWTVEATVVRNGGDDAIFAYDTDGNWTVDSTEIINTTDGIEAGISSGDREILNTTIRNPRANGVNAEKASGEVAIQDTTVINSENAVNFEDSTGKWKLEAVNLRNSSNEGVNVYNFSGSITVQDVSVQKAYNGIDAQKSNGKLVVNNFTVKDTEGDGIDASNATGNATVHDSEFRNMGDKSIDVIDSEGSWQIHESILTGGSEGTLDAWDAKRMINASHNYWGAADGPSETFCGSGGAIGGYNVTMYPYYTDSSLTTLSSATTSGTVQISSSCVIPEDISESNEQDLVLTLSQISADGKSDNITITMPEGVSVDSVGEPRAIGTPYEVDVTNSGGPIKLEVDPDEPEATVDFVLRVPVELSSNEG